MTRFTALCLHTAVAAAALISSAAFAQTTADARPAGKTRAEVVAETKAALQRGELQAGHEWGYDFPAVAPRNVQLAKTSNKAAVPATTQE